MRVLLESGVYTVERPDFFLWVYESNAKATTTLLLSFFSLLFSVSCFSPIEYNRTLMMIINKFLSVLFQQLAGITKALDPKNTGFINFDQFCQGIAQISSLQGVSLKDVASDLTRLSRENSLVEDSDQRSLVSIINYLIKIPFVTSLTTHPKIKFV